MNIPSSRFPGPVGIEPKGKWRPRAYDIRSTVLHERKLWWAKRETDAEPGHEDADEASADWLEMVDLTMTPEDVALSAQEVLAAVQEGAPEGRDTFAGVSAALDSTAEAAASALTAAAQVLAEAFAEADTEVIGALRNGAPAGRNDLKKLSDALDAVGETAADAVASAVQSLSDVIAAGDGATLDAAAAALSDEAAARAEAIADEATARAAALSAEADARAAALDALSSATASALGTLAGVDDATNDRITAMNPPKVAVLTGALLYVDTVQKLLDSLAAGAPEIHIVPNTTFPLGADVPFLQLNNQRIVSHNPSYVPLFQDTLGIRGPDDPMVDIWFRNGELRGCWFGRGLPPTAQNWDDLDDRATYRRGVFLRTRCRPKPGGGYDDAFGLECDHVGGQYVGDVLRAVADLGKVYAVHVRELEGHELTQALWHQFGTDGAFTSTYHTVDRARANSTIIRYLADYLKFGDNAGSGGSPGFAIGWAELYRGGRGIYTYTKVPPVAGTNPNSCRKLRFNDCSLRGQIGDSALFDAGTDVEVYSVTTDDCNHGLHIGPNYEGTIKFLFPIMKDGRKHGFFNESPTAAVTLIEPQVGNNSFAFGTAFTVTPAAIGNGTVGSLSDTFGDDAFLYDGDSVGGNIQNAVVGDWTIVFTSPTTFDVKRPDGTTLGSGTVGAPFVGGTELKLTVVAGSTPFDSGDVITVNVRRANDNRALYHGINSEYPITIHGGVSGVSLSWRYQSGWYGFKAKPGGGYYNAKDGDQWRPGTASSLNVTFKDVVTDPRTQIQIGADAFATRKNAIDFLNACRRDPYISAVTWGARPEEGGGAPLKIDITAKDWSRAWTDWALGFSPAGVSTDDPTAAPIANRMLRSGGSLSDGTGGSLIDGQSAATQGYGIRAPKDSRITGGPLCSGNIAGDMLLF